MNRTTTESMAITIGSTFATIKLYLVAYANMVTLAYS